MINRIRNWFLRAAVESSIDRAARENAKAEADGTAPWTPDLDDRRRLAVSEIFLTAERNDGKVMPAEYGQVILHHSTGEHEVAALADATTRTVTRRIARGQLG